MLHHFLTDSAAIISCRIDLSVKGAADITFRVLATTSMIEYWLWQGNSALVKNMSLLQIYRVCVHRAECRFLTKDANDYSRPQYIEIDVSNYYKSTSSYFHHICRGFDFFCCNDKSWCRFIEIMSLFVCKTNIDMPFCCPELVGSFACLCAPQ